MKIIATLPGTGYVAERVNDDGSRTVLDLVGWAVDEAGEVWPLPRSLDGHFTVRPQVEGDAAAIRKTGVGLMQRPQVGPFGAVAQPWVDDATL